MPLSLSTEEMDLLLTLAAPIDQRQRDQFLHEVAAELEAKRQAGESTATYQPHNFLLVGISDNLPVLGQCGEPGPELVG